MKNLFDHERWAEKPNKLFTRMTGEAFTNKEVIIAHVAVMGFLIIAVLAGAVE
jgi:hypothetical protein